MYECVFMHVFALCVHHIFPVINYSMYLCLTQVLSCQHCKETTETSCTANNRQNVRTNTHNKLQKHPHNRTICNLLQTRKCTLSKITLWGNRIQKDAEKRKESNTEIHSPRLFSFHLSLLFSFHLSLLFFFSHT